MTRYPLGSGSTIQGLGKRREGMAEGSPTGHVRKGRLERQVQFPQDQRLTASFLANQSRAVCPPAACKGPDAAGEGVAREQRPADCVAVRRLGRRTAQSIVPLPRAFATQSSLHRRRTERHSTALQRKELVRNECPSTFLEGKASRFHE
jgi:hypothetical protein